MRQRLLSYFTAACINLLIVSGTHIPTLVSRPAIVRLRDRPIGPGGFDRGELVAGRSVAVVAAPPERYTFNLN